MEKKFSYIVKILETQLDAFGHVNNAAFFELFENARWDMLFEAGMGLDYIKSEKKGPVVLEANVKYKKELLHREVVTIESRCYPSENSIIFNIEQLMIKESGTIAAEAKFIFGVMDLVSRKLIKPDVEWVAGLGL